MNKVRIYIEGGGDSRGTHRRFRKGFDGFLARIQADARRVGSNVNVVSCGSRESAFDNFQKALEDHPDSFNILLVDSETPTNISPWGHLRQQDGWKKPRGLKDEHCHLMVQAMEAWIIADPDALAQYYGAGFQRSAIPKSTDVEKLDKGRINKALKQATRKTQKREYHKIRHGPEILSRCCVATVRSKAAHCDEFFKVLEAQLRTGRKTRTRLRR